MHGQHNSDVTNGHITAPAAHTVSTVLHGNSHIT